jgi:NADH:ubiquinone oxidoreductase subunit F (NADH-binding)
MLALSGVPAVFFDCEALANVAAILRDGSDPGGTKIVTLAGDVAHAYTVEVPLDTPVGALVREIEGCAISAPSGVADRRVYWPDRFEETVGHAMLGQSADTICAELLYAVKDGACAVESAARAAARLHGMSCGKCVFCGRGRCIWQACLTIWQKARGGPATSSSWWSW